MKHIFALAAAAAMVISCASPADSAREDLKLMSFNIRMSTSDELDGENSWLYRKDAAVKMIRELSPDIIGCQEVTGRQRTFLADSLTDYISYGLDRDSGTPDGKGESMSIYFRKERFGMVDNGTIWLSETPDTVSKGWDAACIRTATWVHLKDHNCGDRDLFFLNTHFDHVGVTARLEEGKMLMKWIDERFAAGACMVLTGDFNSTVEDEALAPLVAGMTYARTAVAGEPDTTGTYHGYGQVPVEQRSVIDHIFLKGITPETYRVVTEEYGVPYVSDHYPVMITAKYSVQEAEHK